MNTRPIGCVALFLAASACQGPGCAGPFADACRKAEDLAYVVGVQLADATATGNATFAQSGALQATGRMAVALRVNAVERTVPRFDDVTIRTDTVVARSAFGADERSAVTISVDAAVGAYGGLRVGGTRVGGVDLLGSASAMPDRGGGSLQVGGRPLAYGMGLRVGLLGETRTLPAISLAATARLIPRFSAITPPLPTDSGGTMRLELRDADVSTLGWRLAASKRLWRFGVTGGLGRDEYSGSAGYTVTASDPGLSTGLDRATFTMSRRNAFVGASVAVGRATIAAELGRVYGGQVPAMLNTFGGHRPTVARSYLTLGVRMPAGRTRDPE